MEKSRNNAMREAFLETIAKANQNGNPAFTGEEVTFQTNETDGSVRDHKVVLYTTNVNYSKNVMAALKEEASHARFSDNYVANSVKVSYDNTADVKKTTTMIPFYKTVQDCEHAVFLSTPSNEEFDQANVSFVFSTDPISKSLLASAIASCAGVARSDGGLRKSSVTVDSYFHDGDAVIFDGTYSSTSRSYENRQNNSLLAASILTDVGKVVGYENLGYPSLAKGETPSM